MLLSTRLFKTAIGAAGAILIGYGIGLGSMNMMVSGAIFIILAVVVVFALAGVVALTAKRRNGGTVRGWFEFDKYKTGENAKRSLQDKTRWR